MSEGNRIYDLAMSAAGKATTVSVANNGEVQIHIWNPSNGVLMEEVVLSTLVNVETIQSAFINGDNVYVVDTNENGIEIQSYNLKTGKEAEANVHLSNMHECLATQSAFVCLSSDKRSIHYSSIPFEGAEMKQLTLSSIPASSTIEKISALDHTDSVSLKYSNGKASNLLLLSLVEGKLSETRSYQR